MRTLVVGCDGSGKSTTIDTIKGYYGDKSFESTSTCESQKFKRANLSRPVDMEFIAEREGLYIDLSRCVLEKLSYCDEDENFVGSDSTLVTRLSHNVMRRCIGGPEPDYKHITDEWLDDERMYGLEPTSLVVLTFAPIDVIRSRIRQRQKEGDKSEKFWGFNSPYFLEKYQNAWLEMQHYVDEQGIPFIPVDTSSTPPYEIIERYSKEREALSVDGQQVFSRLDYGY